MKTRKLFSLLLALIVVISAAVPILAAEKKGPSFQSEIPAGYNGTWTHNGYTFTVTDGKISGG